MYQQAQSPWDVANNPETASPPQEYFGVVTINAWDGMLIKGVGKMPYDPNEKNPENGKPYNKVVVVDVAITPLAECDLQWDIKRQMIVGKTSEWGAVTWPSLRDLGETNAAAVNNRFAHIVLADTGRTYVDKNGETKNATAIKFLALYATREDCLAAWQQAFGKENAATQSAPAAQQPATNPASNGSERNTALQFAKAFVSNAVRSSGKDLEKARETLSKMLATQPLVNKYFTVDSPEIVQLMAEALG